MSVELLSVYPNWIIKDHVPKRISSILFSAYTIGLVNFFHVLQKFSKKHLDPLHVFVPPNFTSICVNDQKSSLVFIARSSFSLSAMTLNNISHCSDFFCLVSGNLLFCFQMTFEKTAFQLTLPFCELYILQRSYILSWSNYSAGCIVEKNLDTVSRAICYSFSI